MTNTAIVAVLLAILFSAAAVEEHATAARQGPEYTKDGQMKLPEQYRQWVYLSSGFDMSYNAATGTGDRHVFDNVFANPEAYRTFVNTGTWPGKAVLVLEVRGAQGKGSINQKGSFQGGVVAIEAHVKDEARFPGKWAFFGFDNGQNTAKMIPFSADCYSCHAAHGAVDTTFVQFYPTLLPIAKEKGTLAPEYQAESTK